MPGKYAHTKKRNNTRRPQKPSSTAANTTATGSTVKNATSNGSNNADSTENNNLKSKPRSNGNSSSSKAAAAIHAAIRPNHTSHTSIGIESPENALVIAKGEVERVISEIMLRRFHIDIARLYSVRLHNVARTRLPHFVRLCTEASGSPGWVAANAREEVVKLFFTRAISMDLREAGERVPMKSVLWTYTALRDFALSNDVEIDPKYGLQSKDLIPHFQAILTYLHSLKTLPLPKFEKPLHLPSLDREYPHVIELISELKPPPLIEPSASSSSSSSAPASALDDAMHPWTDWEQKIRVGYSRLVETLWNVASEFDPCGYGGALVLKLTNRWCGCGCTMEQLAGVCERAMRLSEELRGGVGRQAGKGKEWDGRGDGVYGWQTENEEDIWETELDFNGLDTDENDYLSFAISVGELIKWRYIKAERFKDQGNKAFVQGKFRSALNHYTEACTTEPELPYYQVKIAATQLELKDWVAAEEACNSAISQQRSCEAYQKRSEALREQGRTEEADRDMIFAYGETEDNEALIDITTTIPSLMNELTKTLERIKSKASLFNFKETPRINESHKTFLSQLKAIEAYTSGLAQTVNDLSAAPITGLGLGTSAGAGLSKGVGAEGGTTSSLGSKRTGKGTVSASQSLPFKLTPKDEVQLRIRFPPVEIKMPVFNFDKAQRGSDADAEGSYDHNGNGNGKNGTTTEAPATSTRSVDVVVNHDAFREEKTAKTDVRSIMQARVRAREKAKSKSEKISASASASASGSGGIVNDTNGNDDTTVPNGKENEKDMDVEEAMRELTSMFTKFSMEAEREQIPYPGWNPSAVELSSESYDM